MLIKHRSSTPAENETSGTSALVLAVAAAEFGGGERQAQKEGGRFVFLDDDNLFSCFSSKAPPLRPEL